MPGRIIQDELEFLQIIYKKIRKDLLGHLRTGSIAIPRGGGKGIRIPIEVIHIPRLHFAPIPEDADTSGAEDEEGDSETGVDIGIGQGKGQPGTDLGPVDKDPSDDGDGEGEEGETKQAGLGRGGEFIEVEIPPEDIAEMLQEILELPRIQPKGSKDVPSEEKKYTDIRKTGTLLHKRRTLKTALRRGLVEGTYDPRRPRIVIYSEDKRYKVANVVTKPQHNAVIIFMMDVSGSMGREERRVVRYLCSLCEFWLSFNYTNLETVWIIHNGEADEVTREEFFATSRGGGTVISSAHLKMLEVVENRYPPADWNIYPVYLSDGFNWFDDDEVCGELLLDRILPIVNQYSYGEVKVQRSWWSGIQSLGDQNDVSFSPVGNYGKFLKELFRDSDEEERVALTMVLSMDQVPDAIKEFFKRGN